MRAEDIDPAQRLVVIEASAGTGKTYFLEHRFVDLMLRSGASVDQILVVTFTDKATAELRARIRALIAERAPDDERLRAALAGFDRSAIHTIHGFCQRLLVEDAFSGRRLFDQNQVPDEAAFAEAFHATLREEIAVDPALCNVLERYLDAGGSVARLGDTLLACARRGADITPVLDPARLCDAADRLLAAFGHLPRVDGETAQVEAALGPLHASTRNGIAWRMVAIRDAIVAAPGGDLDARAIALAAAIPLEDLAWIVERLDKIVRPLAAGAALVDAISALSPAHVPIAAIAAGRFLGPVLTRVRASKARRGQFDFQDMLRLVWEVLDGERGDELAARLRRRHPFAMIDEFQDTDDLQWKIFQKVWADGGPGTGLTIVGDPKQAIYSFRGADVHTYLSARETLRARGALVAPLADNWRSSAELVGAVNALIDGSHGPFFTSRSTDGSRGTGGIRYDAPVRAASQVGIVGSQSAPVHVFELVPSSGDKLERHQIDPTLAEKTADTIADLLVADPARRLRLRDKHGAERALVPADIHVLTRTGKQSDQIAEALRARGVPCALYQREHLFDADEAREVADLLDAIADPRVRPARLRAWTTSFFAVPLARLDELIEVPDGHPLLALLHDWRGAALRKDWSGLFHRILEDTRWIERTLIAGGGERAITNVLHLFELLHDELARSPCDLGELAARLRGWIRTGQIDRPDDVDLQRLETDRQAVQVMTIHRAKGLEAAVVFVFGGHAPGPDRDEARLYHDADGARLLHVGKPFGAVERAIETDVVEENQRLLYVAMTRAKVRLYLPLLRQFHLPSTSALATLHDRLIAAVEARALDPESARLFEVERVVAGSLTAPEPAEAAEDLAGWAPPVAPAPLPAPDRDAIRAARGGVIVTSYSRLRDAEVRGEDHSAAIALSDDELPAGASSGLFLHEIFEHVPFASARAHADWQTWGAHDEIAPVIERAARRHGVAERHRPLGARTVHGALLQEIHLEGETLPPLADATRIAREVEFTYPLALPGGREAFARGFVDLLVGWDERVWVVDYKSDAIDAHTVAQARPHTMRHYGRQAQLYAVAAARLCGLDGDGDTRRRFGGVLYWYLRSGLVVDIAVTWRDVAHWTSELAAVVAAGGAP